LNADECEDNIKKDFQMLDRGRAGLIWFTIRTSGSLLWTW